MLRETWQWKPNGKGNWKYEEIPKILDCRKGDGGTLKEVITGLSQKWIFATSDDVEYHDLYWLFGELHILGLFC